MVNLISFPRSGCHWLMRLIELCADRPRISRQGKPIPWYDSEGSPWGVHHHDYEFVNDSGRIKLREDGLDPKNFHSVIYLYRDPVDTLYSLFEFIDCPKTEENVAKASECYYKHKYKWLNGADNIQNFLTVRYEDLVNNGCATMEVILDFLEEDYSRVVTEDAFDRVKNKTTALKRARNFGHLVYERHRADFRENFSKIIMDKKYEAINAKF